MSYDVSDIPLFLCPIMHVTTIHSSPTITMPIVCTVLQEAGDAVQQVQAAGRAEGIADPSADLHGGGGLLLPTDGERQGAVGADGPE